MIQSEIISIYKGVKTRTISHLKDLKYLKPLEKKMSSYELITHISLIEKNLFIERLKSGLHTYKHSEITGYTEKEEIIHLYESVFVETLEFFKSKDDIFFKQSVTTLNGNQVSAFKWIHLLLEHEIHHRSQILFYLSLDGTDIEPIFGIRSEQIMNFE